VVRQRRAKLWLSAFIGMTALALGIAGTARASASFNTDTRSGFVSRGDVIAAGGKDALVANPFVVYNAIHPFTETCTWPNGTSVQASGHSFLFLLYQAETMYAPGSGTITGYTFSLHDLIDGETDPVDPTRAACFAARGLHDDGSAITQALQWGPVVRTLTLNATVLPFHS
jgi:hypothetical protein